MTIAVKINELLADLNNWNTIEEVVEAHPQFTVSQLRRLVWLRNEKPGLSRCMRKMGKKAYINAPAFSIWMTGQFPEQLEAEQALESA